MRKTLLTTAALFSLALTAPAFAQTATGTAPAAPNAGNEMPQSPNSAPQGAAVNGAPGADAGKATQTAPAEQAPATDKAAAAGSMAPAKTTGHHSMHHVAKTADSADDVTGGNWAHQPGTGMSGPASMTASNIDQADSHSNIAPHFPEPKVGAVGSPEQYLMAAQTALAAHHTGAAQQALEMAETRLLDRSTPVNAAGQPDENPMVASVAAARQALGHNDMAGAKAAIKTALATPATGSN
jgi:hypothetical protein